MKQVFLINGIVLIILAILMIPCFAVDFIAKKSDYAFLLSIAITFTFGIFFFKLGGVGKLDNKHVLFITTYNWAIIAIFAAIPFKMYGLSSANSLFEAVSGITTTGATIFTNLEQQSKGILLWRALLHFIGGIGVIIFAIAVFPMLKNVSVQKLFYTEFSDRSEKIAPHISYIAVLVLTVYFVLIICCGLTYYFLGMDPFDAVCHSISTIATGGFTNYDESFAHYTNPAIHRVAIVFMLLGALPFVWYIRMIYQKKLLYDEQSFWFFTAVFFVSFISAVSMENFSGYLDIVSFIKHLEDSLFSITSLITTTGFVNSDYSIWTPCFTGLSILFLIFIGGCAGSTSGGMKFFRIIILAKNVKKELIKLINSKQIFILRFNKNSIDESAICSITSFLILYLGIFIISSLAISLLGYDYITSISAAAATLTNAGPGLGEIVGPLGNYSSLPDIAKIILTFNMLLGRLEIVTVFTFFIVIAKGNIKWNNNESINNFNN